MILNFLPTSLYLLYLDEPLKNQLIMNYWAVGAAWESTEDVSTNFIEDGVWYDGYAEHDGNMKYKKQWEQVKPNDVIVMKSSATKGKDHSIPFTRIKAIGHVKEKVKPPDFKVK